MKKKVVVIGAGLAGTLIANRLARTCDVTCLEIGPRHGTRYPPITFERQALAHVRTFCHGAGGGTNLWHNGLIPLRLEDVQESVFRHALEDSQAFTDEAANALHFPLPSYAEEFARVADEAASLADSIALFRSGIDCLLYPKKYAPLVLADSVRAIYEVERIDFIANSDRVSQVRISCGKKQEILDADETIVAAGGLGTPRLLSQLVNVFGHPGLKPGDGFIDHPMGFVGKFRFSKETARKVNKLALLNRNGYQSRSIIRLKSKCGLYTGGAFFRPSVTMNNDLALYKYKSLLGISRGWDKIRSALSPKIVHPDILAEIVTHLFPITLPTRTFSVLFIGEQRRNDHRVHYQDGRLHVDWTISDLELSKYKEMISELGSDLADIAEDSVLEPELTADWFWSAAHHSGTTSMGNAESDIVDANLKLRCAENVYVCDASIIQEHSYANTGLTIGQFAFRLADHLERSR